jgi:hypothetical protein
MVHDKRLLPACITARSQLEVELAVIGCVKQLNSLSGFFLFYCLSTTSSVNSRLGSLGEPGNPPGFQPL